MRIRANLWFALFLCISGWSCARAWIPVSFADPDLVDRSELIVVARVIPGTIKFLPYGKGGWGDHSLELEITSALKGNPPSGPLTVLVHYGLTPVVGGYLKEGDMTIGDRATSHLAPDTIQIYSTNPGMAGGPPTANAGQDNIWFLRRNDSRYQYDAKNTLYGIFHDQDVQPLETKSYFEGLLSDHPIKAIEPFTAGNAYLATRARNSAQILRLHEVEAEPDADLRSTRLAAFLLTLDPGADRGALDATAQTIVKEGPHAGAKLIPAFNDALKKSWRQCILRIWEQTKNPEVGPMLVPVFNDFGSVNLRGQIINVWRNLGYRDSSPLLIALLKEEDRYWAGQHIADSNWWNAINDPVCETRRDSYGRVYGAVYALGIFKDPAAIDEIELTRQRWKMPMLDQQGQIVNACDDTLKAIAEAQGKQPAPSR